MGPYARSRDGMRARKGSGASSLARKGEEAGSQKFLKATRGRGGSAGAGGGRGSGGRGRGRPSAQPSCIAVSTRIRPMNAQEPGHPIWEADAMGKTVEEVAPGGADAVSYTHLTLPTILLV